MHSSLTAPLCPHRHSGAAAPKQKPTAASALLRLPVLRSVPGQYAPGPPAAPGPPLFVHSPVPRHAPYHRQLFPLQEAVLPLYRALSSSHAAQHRSPPSSAEPPGLFPDLRRWMTGADP